MRWYSAGIISVVAGLIFAGVLLYSGVPEHLVDTVSLRSPLWVPWLLQVSLITIIFFAPSIAFSVLLYCCLTRFAGGPAHDAETRCRKCRYILRGILEPRCPECGERI